MEIRFSSLLVLVGCVLVMCETVSGTPLPDHALRDLPGPNDGVVHQHLGAPPVGGARRRLNRQRLRNLENYADAIYAGKFAQELDRLEKNQNEVFVDFISAGFYEEEIPRSLPSDLQHFSRMGPIPAVPLGSSFPSSPVSTAVSSSQVSLGNNAFLQEEVSSHLRSRVSLNPEVADSAKARSFLRRQRGRRPFIHPDRRAHGFPFARSANGFPLHGGSNRFGDF